jgi:hypothetical protein
MRLFEFEHGPLNTPESNLLTALELIRNRYKDKDQPPKISTQSLINMVLNTDKTFNYDALVNANKNNPAVQNLIKSYNKNYVELNNADVTADDESTTTNTPDSNPTQNPVDTVDDMAKRAAAARGAPIADQDQDENI